MVIAKICSLEGRRLSNTAIMRTTIKNRNDQKDTQPDKSQVHDNLEECIVEVIAVFVRYVRIIPKLLGTRIANLPECLISAAKNWPLSDGRNGVLPKQRTSGERYVLSEVIQYIYILLFPSSPQSLRVRQVGASK